MRIALALVLALASTALADTKKDDPKKDAAKAAPGPAAAAAAISGKTELTWWGHAAWVVKSPKGTVLAIDPWLENPKAPQGAKWPEKVDAILVTHGHSDHVGNTAALAAKTGAQVIGSYELTGLIGAAKSNGGNIGGAMKVGDDITVNLVEAVHSSGFGNDPKSIQYGGPAMGYVIQIAGGPTLYHAGDTGFFASMQTIGDYYKPDVALLPIGGHYTMDPQGAALAAKMLGVKTVIPMHFGTFPALAGTPDQLRAAIKTGAGKAEVNEFKPGETKAL